MIVIRRKYNNMLGEIRFPLYDADNPKRFKSGITFAAADTQIKKDGASFANTNSVPTELNSTGIYTLDLDGANEMEFAHGTILIADATATPVWMDQAIEVTTYGNGAAFLVPDYSDSPDVNVKLIGAVLVTDGFSKAVAKVNTFRVEDSGFAPTVTQFRAILLTGDGGAALDDVFIDRQCIWTTGVNEGSVFWVQQYTDSTVEFVVTRLQGIPADDDQFIML